MKIKNKHSRTEHFHVRGWVVKAMFCYSYFVNEVKACVCEISMVFFWLEGCKIRVDQSSLKLGLQNKVVTIGPLKKEYKVVRMFI